MDAANGVVFTLAVATKPNDHAITASDGNIIADGTSNTVTITLPTASGITGRQYSIKCIDDTFAVDVACNGAEEIDGQATQNLNQWDCLVVVSDGTNWIVV